MKKIYTEPSLSVRRAVKRGTIIELGEDGYCIATDDGWVVRPTPWFDYHLLEYEETDKNALPCRKVSTLDQAVEWLRAYHEGRVERRRLYEEDEALYWIVLGGVVHATPQEDDKE